ncbi:hypothetical protein CTM55_11180 [Prevotella intermedia]|nr:hypothetical protein CTM55_11180 [Prevotella intermedia]
MLGRKQRSQVARSFPNRYQFSCTNKVTSLFSISCILRIILHCKTYAFGKPKKNTRFSVKIFLQLLCIIVDRKAAYLLTRLHLFATFLCTNFRT